MRCAWCGCELGAVPVLGSPEGDVFACSAEACDRAGWALVEAYDAVMMRWIQREMERLKLSAAERIMYLSGLVEERAALGGGAS